MLLISSRKNFWEPNFFSNNEAVKDIDLTIPNDPGTDISDADLLAAVTGKKLHLLIHGQNNDEAGIPNSYPVIAAMMSSQGRVGATPPYCMLRGPFWARGNPWVLPALVQMH